MKIDHLPHYPWFVKIRILVRKKHQIILLAKVNLIKKRSYITGKSNEYG